MAEPPAKRDWFLTLSNACSKVFGSRWAFLSAILVVVIWAIVAPYYHYSDTWQLVINTGTTIVTFLMVFLIQHTQNRDAKAINLKLDEIVFAIKRAKNDLIEAEKLSDEELEELEAKYARIREIYTKRREKRAADPSETAA
ncbi:MAG TPA: low affinity iron permease family protein [Terriglobales bacterium]|nr:low affinity iron permease family protein [Terriglobales bacterium]